MTSDLLPCPACGMLLPSTTFTCPQCKTQSVPQEHFLAYGGSPQGHVAPPRRKAMQFAEVIAELLCLTSITVLAAFLLYVSWPGGVGRRGLAVEPAAANAPAAPPEPSAIHPREQVARGEKLFVRIKSAGFNPLVAAEMTEQPVLGCDRFARRGRCR